MKAIGIVGFKKSGKTTLGVRLAAELSRRGLRTGVIKHTSEGIDLPAADSTLYHPVSGFVAVIGPEQTEILLKGAQPLEEILKYFIGDFLIVEGFKHDPTFPKIVCLRKPSETKELCQGLEIALASFTQGLGHYQIQNDADVKTLADLAQEKGFKLPALDCGKCAYQSCEALAKAIVAGKAALEECVSLNPPLSIAVDGKEFALNPFTAHLCKQTILGMLSSLKGFKKGEVIIRIP